LSIIIGCCNLTKQESGVFEEINQVLHQFKAALIIELFHAKAGYKKILHPVVWQFIKYLVLDI